MLLESLTHPFEPVYDSESTILVLGSFPSVISRKNNFYYSNPQNRFWQVLSSVFDENLPYTIEEKKALVLKNHIALWDVLASCDISGSDDSSIKNPVPNDFTKILAESQIKTIYTTGEKAHKLYKKYCFKKTGIEDILLPSTSPANQGRYPLNLLIDKYMILKTGREAEYTLKI